MNEFEPVDPIRVDARIEKKSDLGAGMFRFDVSSTELARMASPGRFMLVRGWPGLDPLLSRPLAFYRILPDLSMPMGFSLLFRVAGRGTKILSMLDEGGVISIFGPLGRGFDVKPFDGMTLLIAGGIGAVPIMSLAQAIVAKGSSFGPARILYGAKTSAELVALSDFEDLGLPISVCTDDGTRGEKANGIEMAAAEIEAARGKVRIFAVGPEVMFKALKKLLGGRSIPAWISLEKRMACGLGVCRSCVVRRGAAGKGTEYNTVCASGPVFSLDEIDFDEMD